MCVFPKQNEQKQVNRDMMLQYKPRRLGAYHWAYTRIIYSTEFYGTRILSYILHNDQKKKMNTIFTHFKNLVNSMKLRRDILKI